MLITCSECTSFPKSTFYLVLIFYMRYMVLQILSSNSKQYILILYSHCRLLCRLRKNLMQMLTLQHYWSCPCKEFLSTCCSYRYIHFCKILYLNFFLSNNIQIICFIINMKSSRIHKHKSALRYNYKTKIIFQTIAAYNFV